VAARERTGHWRTAVLLAAGATYALGAATSTPFSRSADVVTALPMVVLAVFAVARWPLHPRPPETAATMGGQTMRAWVALAVAVVGWELAAYFARGSRGAHPTLSSMADAVDRHYGLKALVFFGWLCLGAWIIEAGTPSGAATEAP
jgi:hypothetical protein